MFTKTAKVTQAKVLAKRKIITYFHFSTELKKKMYKKYFEHFIF